MIVGSASAEVTGRKMIGTKTNPVNRVLVITEDLVSIVYLSFQNSGV